MTWLLVFLGMIVGLIVGSIVSFIFVVIEKPMQWGGKSLGEWKALGVENPGERLTLISFMFGMLSTTFSRFIAYLSGLFVFIWKGEEPSMIPMIIFAVILLVKDFVRFNKFRGQSGQVTEIGYLIGGLLGLILFLFIKSYIITLLS